MVRRLPGWGHNGHLPSLCTSNFSSLCAIRYRVQTCVSNGLVEKALQVKEHRLEEQISRQTGPRGRAAEEEEPGEEGLSYLSRAEWRGVSATAGADVPRAPVAAAGGKSCFGWLGPPHEERPHKVRLLSWRHSGEVAARWYGAYSRARDLPPAGADARMFTSTAIWTTCS